MPTSRRQFIRVAAGATLLSTLRAQQAVGANDRVRIALLGCGNRGKALIRQFLKVPGVACVAVCDPDTGRMDSLAATVLKSGGGRVETIRDYRKLYERPDIDAVVIATPNYWHALQAIQALEAGKHVYVEKPVTFTLWEALQLEAAERNTGRIITAGYQNRSDPGPQQGIRYVQAGNLGRIRKVRALCFRNRSSIGKLDRPLTPPATVDYDLWLGPARDLPILRPKFHYDWHWDFNTGNGDVGNQGVHEIDLVCWLLGDPPLPTRVRSFGNRFAWDDAGNTPNLQVTWYQVDGVEVILETNDMTLSPERNVSPNRLGTRVGIIVECEKGILKGGRNGMVVVEPDGRTIVRKFPGDGGKSHQPNFIEAIRAGDARMLSSRIKDAHLSASIAHLGNISYRLGELAGARELEGALDASPDLTEIIADQAGQLADWGVAEPRYRLGRTLEVEPASQTVQTRGVGPELTGPCYRKGFELQPLT